MNFFQIRPRLMAPSGPLLPGWEPLVNLIPFVVANRQYFLEMERYT